MEAAQGKEICDSVRVSGFGAFGFRVSGFEFGRGFRVWGLGSGALEVRV